MPRARRRGRRVARESAARARRTPFAGARSPGEPTNTSSAAAGGAAQPTPVQPPLGQDEPMMIDGNDNQQSGDQQNDVITKEALQDFITRTLSCHIARAPCHGHLGTDEPAFMCPGCSKLSCGGCYGRKRKCSYCGLAVTKNGLIKCLWIADVISVLNEALAVEWTADGPGEQAAEALEKASRAIECPICMDTILDAGCCRRCSKPYCKHCLTRALGNSLVRECPCCVAPMMSIDDAIPCAWLEPLGKMIDTLLKKPMRVLPVDPTPNPADMNDYSQPPSDLDVALHHIVHSISDSVAQTVGRVVHDIVRRTIGQELNAYHQDTMRGGGSSGRGGRHRPY